MDGDNEFTGIRTCQCCWKMIAQDEPRAVVPLGCIHADCLGEMALLGAYHLIEEQMELDDER